MTNPSFYQVLAVIAISSLLGVFVGAWLMQRSINYLMSRGVMDVFYHGKQQSHFRLF